MTLEVINNIILSYKWTEPGVKKIKSKGLHLHIPIRDLKQRYMHKNSLIIMAILVFP